MSFTGCRYRNKKLLNKSIDSIFKSGIVITFVILDKAGLLMIDFKQVAAEQIANVTDLQSSSIVPLLAKSPNPEMGDLGFPCFTLAKAMKKAPQILAQEIAAKLEPSNFFSSIKPVGPYINFTVDTTALAKQTIEQAIQKNDNWGASLTGAGKTIVIDYSSPNVAKPLAIHHLRTNVIGAALMRMYRFTGHHVVTINHLGDWGTTFGQLIVAYKRKETEVKNVDVGELFKLYVQFHADAADDESLDEEARAWFKKLEDGDTEAKRLWKLFVDESMKPLMAVYDRLGLTFDHFMGEAFFNDLMQPTVERLEKTGLLKTDQCAKIVDLEAYGMPPCLILKSDGATTYATRDLAAAEYRADTFKFDKCLYVVANQQELHFRQLFQTLKLMGYSWADGMHHVKFGMLSLGAGVLKDDSGVAMTGSTRKGRVVFLSDVLDKSVERAKALILENMKDEAIRDEIDTLAEDVGVGAVVFTEFMQRRIKDITFTWERALNLQGDSGPYLQYTHARLASILRRYNKPIPKNLQLNRLSSQEERNIMLTLLDFSHTIQQAVSENEPSFVATYLLELCAVFNKMYSDKKQFQILQATPSELADARIALVEAVRITVKNGLKLLGIKAPQRM